MNIGQFKGEKRISVRAAAQKKGVVKKKPVAPPTRRASLEYTEPNTDGEITFERWMYKMEEDVDRLLSGLDRVELNLMKLTVPEPELSSVTQLERQVSQFQKDWECKDWGTCSHCTVTQRNSCWLYAQKEIKKKSLVGGLPYTRERLATLNRSELVSVAGMLGINIFRISDKSGLGVIAEILKKQNDLGLMKE